MGLISRVSSRTYRDFVMESSPAPISHNKRPAEEPSTAQASVHTPSLPKSQPPSTSTETVTPTELDTPSSPKRSRTSDSICATQETNPTETSSISNTAEQSSSITNASDKSKNTSEKTENESDDSSSTDEDDRAERTWRKYGKNDSAQLMTQKIPTYRSGK